MTREQYKKARPVVERLQKIEMKMTELKSIKPNQVSQLMVIFGAASVFSLQSELPNLGERIKKTVLEYLENEKIKLLEEFNSI